MSYHTFLAKLLFMDKSVCLVRHYNMANLLLARYFQPHTRTSFRISSTLYVTLAGLERIDLIGQDESLFKLQAFSPEVLTIQLLLNLK